MARPRGVFTVDCPKATRNEVSNVEYNIYKGDDPIPLMVVKNLILRDDVKKAAKCAGFNKFIITNPKSFSPINTPFPLRRSISIREYVDYRIIRAFDNKLINVVKMGILKSDIERAALHAGFGKEYTIEYNKHVEKAADITSSTVIRADVYLRRDYTSRVQVFNASNNTPTMQPKPVDREFKICDVTGKELMIVKGSITASDAHKSIGCAGFKGGEAYIYKKGTSIPLKGSDFPIQCDLVIKKNCESTSIPPVKKPAVKKSPTFMIFDEDGRHLMEVADFITIEDVKKAAKCAKIHPTEAYVTRAGHSTKLIGSNYPQRNDLIIHRSVPTAIRNAGIFSVCESTTVAPVRAPEPVVVVSAVLAPTPKQKLIKIAIKGLESAISALAKLEKII